MIRVNLVSPTKTVSGAAQIGNFTRVTTVESAAAGMALSQDGKRQALVKLVVMLIFPALLMVYEQQTIPTKTQELAKLRTKLQEIQQYNSKDQAAVEEIKKFKAEEARIQEGITAIEKISKNRMKIVKVLDLIQQAIPEKAWFNNVDVRESKVTIVGFASTDFEITSFIETLAKSVFLVDVNLVNSSEEKIDGIVYRRFEVSCVLEKGS